MHIFRIKKNKENVQRCAKTLPGLKKNKSEDVIRFEQCFYDEFNQQLAKHGPQCFEQARIKCLRLQKGILFKNCPDVQKMKFSRHWWQRFQSDRGMRWKKICSNRKSFTNNEVEEERERLRAIMPSYQHNEIWNFDESSFNPNFTGSYSVQSPDVLNIPKTPFF